MVGAARFCGLAQAFQSRDREKRCVQDDASLGLPHAPLAYARGSAMPAISSEWATSAERLAISKRNTGETTADVRDFVGGFPSTCAGTHSRGGVAAPI